MLRSLSSKTPKSHCVDDTNSSELNPLVSLHAACHLDLSLFSTIKRVISSSVNPWFRVLAASAVWAVNCGVWQEAGASTLLSLSPALIKSHCCQLPKKSCQNIYIDFFHEYTFSSPTSFLLRSQATTSSWIQPDIKAKVLSFKQD